MSQGKKPGDLELIRQSMDSMHTSLNRLVDAIHLQSGRLDDQDNKIKSIEAKVDLLQGNPVAKYMLWKGIGVSALVVLGIITLVAMVSS